MKLQVKCVKKYSYNNSACMTAYPWILLSMDQVPRLSYVLLSGAFPGDPGDLTTEGSRPQGWAITF